MKLFQRVKLNKKIKNQADLTVATFILIGILVTVNFLSFQIFYRFDLTENNIYSISKSTKKTLKSLDDIVSVKLYFSKDLPPEFINLTQDIRDILDEYKNYSKGKIRIEEISPGDSTDEERKFQILGIPKVRFNVVKQDKFEALGGYLGMVIYFEDKKEIIPFIKSSQNLEYEITTIIKKLTLKDVPTVAFATGNEEVSLEKLKVVFEELKKQYKITVFDLSQGDLVPDNINTLIIAGAKSSFNERSKYIIDQFLMRGGNLLVAEDSFTVEQNLISSPNEGTLSDLLEFYGVKINKDLVLDGASSEMVSFSGGIFPVSVNYPFWPKILKENFDKENPVTSNLETVFFPWASSLSLLQEKTVNNKISELVKTSDKSWLMKETLNLDPFQQFTPQGFNKYSLAVSILGKFESFYKDKEHPQKENEISEKEADKKDEPFNSFVEKGNLVVIGDADFLKDDFLTRNVNNLIFFQNMVDSMTLGQDLINIRSKGSTDRPIKEVPESKKKTLKYFNIFGSTIIVIIFGIIKYYLRKRKKFSEEI